MIARDVSAGNRLRTIFLVGLGLSVLVAIAVWVFLSFTLDVPVRMALRESFDGPEPFMLVLVDSAPDSDVRSLQSALISSRDVAGVEYVSKSEALTRLREDWPSSDKDELASLEQSNTLPVSLTISLKDPRDEQANRRVIELIESHPAFDRIVQKADGPEWWIRY